MTTKRKMNRRAKKKMDRNCWNLDSHLMDYTTNHLRHYLRAIKKTDFGGFPSEFSHLPETEAVAKWHGIIEDMIYYTSNYDLFINGRSANDALLAKWEKDNTPTPFVKIRDVPDGELYEYRPNNANWPGWLYRLDAIHDQERYLRGRKSFIKYFSSLWW